MNKTKRYRLSQDMYKIIQNANGGLFLLYTRHNPGDVLNLLLDGNDIGLFCRVESCNDQYIKLYTVFFLHAKENNLKTAQIFDDPYDAFVFKLFYNSLSGYRASRLFPETKSSKQLLEDYFKIDLL